MKSLIARLLNRKAYRHFEFGTQHPEQAYRQLENEILGLVRQGSFWPARQKQMNSINDFPITDYETYRSVLSKAFQESISPLTGEKIDFWCTSSGSSAEPKLFPMTETFRQQLLRISGALSYFVARRLGRNMNYPLIFFPGTGTGQKSPAGVEIGFISRYMFLKLPSFIRNSYAIPAELFENDLLLSEWGPLYGMAKDISSMLAILPAIIAHYCETIENRKQEYFEILSGKRPWPAGIPPIKVSAARLQQIEKAISKTPFSMQELWPHLNLIVSWKGSTAGLQIPRLEKFRQGKIYFSDAIYSATEGWMTVPTLQNEGVGNPLHLGATYVEFLPENAEVKAENLLKPWQLKVGENYEVFLSQGMGFIRYRLLDVVRCNAFYHRSPILEFMYKAGNMVSMGQTRFSEVNILEAVRQTGFYHPHEWTIAPAADGTGVIFHTVKTEPGLEEQVRKMDSALALINSEIEDDYVKGLLQRMRVQLSPSDHPFWVSARHAQGKQRVLSKKPL